MTHDEAMKLPPGTRVGMNSGTRRGRVVSNASATGKVAIIWDEEQSSTYFVNSDLIHIDQEANDLNHIYARYEMVRLVTMMHIYQATMTESSLFNLRKWIRYNIAKRWRHAFPDYKTLREMLAQHKMTDDPSFEATALIKAELEIKEGSQ